MAKVLFIDDRLNEVVRLWEDSGCAQKHELLALEPFDCIEQMLEMVKIFEPEAILVGFGLSHPEVNGADVIQALRKNGFSGKVIANSGGGQELFDRAGVDVDFSVNRNPRELEKVMGQLEEKKR